MVSAGWPFVLPPLGGPDPFRVSTRCAGHARQPKERVAAGCPGAEGVGPLSLEDRATSQYSVPPVIASWLSRHHLETDASFNPGERRLVGGVSLKRAGGGIVVRSPEMVPVGMYSFSLGFLASATLAEAMVLLRGMKVARQRHGVTALRARTDAAHLVEILHGRAKAHDPALRNVVERIAADIELFEDFEIKWARSSHARERQAGVPTADALARKAAGLAQRRYATTEY